MEFAFTAIITETGATIGAATRDIQGHSTLSNMPEFKTYGAASDFAEILNAKLGLSTLEAWKIVASSMK